MKVEGVLFGLGFIFYAFLAGIYWYFSRDEVGIKKAISDKYWQGE